MPRLKKVVPVDPVLLPAFPAFLRALGVFEVLAEGPVTLDGACLLPIDEEGSEDDRAEALTDGTVLDGGEGLLLGTEGEDESPPGGELREEPPGGFDGRRLDQDAVVRGVLREAVGPVTAVDEHLAVARPTEVVAGDVDEAARDVDRLYVVGADDLGEDGDGVARTRADDEDVVAGLGVERVEEACDGAGGEDGRAVALGGTVEVRRLIEERLARDRAHGETDRLRAETPLRGVLEAVDHVLAQHRVVHVRVLAPTLFNDATDDGVAVSPGDGLAVGLETRLGQPRLPLVGAVAVAGVAARQQFDAAKRGVGVAA
jgi:hypothetical protein